ncbi:MAG: hypothetical protein ABL888_17085 [Pirellulaceae bacterium]
MLIFWCMFASALLIVSLIVHASTFFMIDPTPEWRGVIVIHLAIFPTFFAALFFANRIGGRDQASFHKLVNAAPRWLRVLSAVFFTYALVNLAIFAVISEGGGPEMRDGKYFLMSHGNSLRELSENEYHQHRAYGVRFASGHSMMFSSASLMLLVGAARRNVAEQTKSSSHV